MSEPKIAIIGEAWGEQEARERRPFVGPSGRYLNYCLRVAGIDRDKCFLTNVFNLQPKPTNAIENLCGKKVEGIPNRPPIAQGKYIRREYEPELHRLYRELDVYKPDLIIALGATAAWATIGKAGIRKVRGAAHVGYAGIKVIPTYHPAAVLRQHTLFPILIADLQKARKESYFTEVRRPQRFIHVDPTYDDLFSFEREYIDTSSYLSIDIETAGNQITCIGFATSIDRALVVPFVDDTKPDKNYWATKEIEVAVWQWVRRICGLEKARIVGQNFNYDMKFLIMSYGIPVTHASDDIMLMHHALQPEMEKSLGFMASIYTDELAWKFMRPKHQLTVKKED